MLSYLCHKRVLLHACGRWGVASTLSTHKGTHFFADMQEKSYFSAILFRERVPGGIFWPRNRTELHGNKSIYSPTDYTDIHWYAAYLCQSVRGGGWYISHGETSFRGYALTTELHGTARKQEYIFSHWLHWSTLIFHVSVSICAGLWDIIAHWLHWYALIFQVFVSIRARQWDIISPCPTGRNPNYLNLFPCAPKEVDLGASCWFMLCELLI